MSYPIPNRVPLPTMRPNPQMLPAQAPMGTIMRGADGRNMQMIETTGMAGANGPSGWTPVNTSQPQRRGIMGMAQQNPEMFLALGAGLLGGRTGREQWAGGLSGMAQAMGAAREKKESKAKANQTRAALEKMGADPELLSLADAGAISWGDAYKMSREAKTPTKPNFINAGDGNLYNADSGEWIRPPDSGSGADFDTESKLRAEYLKSDPVKQYETVKGAYEKVRNSASFGTGPGDMSLVFGFMKMLDPGSTVREGEFASAQNSGGVSAKIRNMYNAAIDGQILTPEQRSEFVRTAEGIYNEVSSNMTDANTRYDRLAEDYGASPGRITYTPEKFAPLEIGQTKQVTTSDGKPATIKRLSR